jgi:hypothetical protein
MMTANDAFKADHGYYRYPMACGDVQCDPRTGFETVESQLVPRPRNCFFGSTDSRYQMLGSYVPSAYYTSGCISEDCSNSLATRSRCNKIVKPPNNIGYGLSSADMMFPGPFSSQGCCNDFNLSYYNPCASGMVSGRDPCGIKDDCHPFDDTVIDEPRDIAYLDSLRGDQTFITTNFNQSTDLRGDLPVGLDCTPVGASQTTHGAYAMLKQWRGYVY